MKSRKIEEREMAMNLCSLLLHHDPDLTMQDLVLYDLEARDLINKSANQKLWQAINHMDTQNLSAMTALREEVFVEVQ